MSSGRQKSPQLRTTVLDNDLKKLAYEAENASMKCIICILGPEKRGQRVLMTYLHALLINNRYEPKKWLGL